MSQKQVALIFGGKSSEHDVSLLSAHNINIAIDRDKYHVILIYISRDGQWQVVNDVGVEPSKGLPISIDINNGTFVNGEKVFRPDVVFPVLHGKYGEDGTIQGLLEMMNVPYVGCGVLASALCMDKKRTKLMVKTLSDVRVSRWHYFDHAVNLADELTEFINSDISRKLGAGPWFVKPSCAGSSVGVSKVHSPGQLEDAIKVAFEHDSTVLVEESVTGREVEVAVLGTPPDHIVSRPGEIIVGDSFYNYDEKYSDSSSAKIITNVNDLPEELIQKTQDQALLIYSTLGCEGLSRVDFFVTKDQKVYFNEVNTLPGFTNISMYPKLWHEQGLSYEDLVSALIDDALAGIKL